MNQFVRWLKIVTVHGSQLRHIMNHKLNCIFLICAHPYCSTPEMRSSPCLSQGEAWHSPGWSFLTLRSLTAQLCGGHPCIPHLHSEASRAFSYSFMPCFISPVLPPSGFPEWGWSMCLKASIWWRLQPSKVPAAKEQLLDSGLPYCSCGP